MMHIEMYKYSFLRTVTIFELSSAVLYIAITGIKRCTIAESLRSIDEPEPLVAAKVEHLLR